MRSNSLAAALENVDMIKQAYETAENSAGSAMREQEKYEQSIQYSLNRFKASAQELANSAISSDLVKDIVDGGAKIIDVITNITETFDTAGLSISAFVAIASKATGLD